MILASVFAARTRGSLSPVVSTAGMVTAGTLLLAGCSAAPSTPSGTTSALNQLRVTGTTQTLMPHYSKHSVQ